jgi:hypothetical protein
LTKLSSQSLMAQRWKCESIVLMILWPICFINCYASHTVYIYLPISVVVISRETLHSC